MAFDFEEMCLVTCPFNPYITCFNVMPTPPSLAVKKASHQILTHIHAFEHANTSGML